MSEPTDELLRSWLLRRLSAQQAEELEEQLLQDDAIGARLRAIETDLLDEHARGRLDAADQDAVAAALLATPADLKRLDFARALAEAARTTHRSADSARPGCHASSARARWSPRRRQWIAAAAVLASAAAILVAGVGLRPQRSAPAEGMLATITLRADQQRGTQSNEVDIPRGAARIRLQAEVDAAPPATRYTLDISDSAHTRFRASDLVAQYAAPYHFVEVTVPASIFTSGRQRVDVVAQHAGETATSWLIHTRIN